MSLGWRSNGTARLRRGSRPPATDMVGCPQSPRSNKRCRARRRWPCRLPVPASSRAAGNHKGRTALVPGRHSEGHPWASSLTGRIGEQPQAGRSFGETIVGTKPMRHAAAVTMLAGAVMLLAPAPAHAEYVCWMSDGIRYCYDPGDRQVPAEPAPAPAVEPSYTPALPVRGLLRILYAEIVRDHAQQRVGLLSPPWHSQVDFRHGAVAVLRQQRRQPCLGSLRVGGRGEAETGRDRKIRGGKAAQVEGLAANCGQRC